MLRRRYALVGSRADFTRAVLAGLLTARCPPALLLLHLPRSAARALPVEVRHGVDALATVNGLPVRTTGDGAETLRACETAEVELALVACYPRRLPVERGAVPPLGVFNLHPAPLPAFRGPTPLFWQFRAGVAETAVTLHRVDDDFDTGAVLATAPLPLAAGVRHAQVTERLAALGAELAADTLLGGGPIPAGEPQDESRASYVGFPQAGAFDLSGDWPAERLFRFVAGTAAPGRLYRLRDGERRWRIESVIDFDPAATQPQAVLPAGPRRLLLGCSPGVVRAVGEPSD